MPFCNISTLPILYQNNHCYILPDHAPLSRGHILIIPKEHIEGMARCSDDTFSSMLDCVEMVKKVYGNNVMFFEHGSYQEDNAGSSISHAHLHAIPVNIDIKEPLIRFLGANLKGISLSDLNCKELSSTPYIFVQNNYQCGYYFPVGTLPRQFLRKIVLAQISPLQNYDWEKTYSSEASLAEVRETIFVWQAYIS